MHKYVSYAKLLNDIDKINGWFRHCQAKVIPYVTISLRRKYADVQWDYINLPVQYDDVLRAKGPEFVQGFQELFRRHATKQSEYRVSSFVATFLNIEPEKAPSLAEELFDYIYRELKLDVETSNR